MRYRGVSWHKGDKKFRAKLRTPKRHVWLGEFTTAEEAAWAWDAAARLFHGAEARTNFREKPSLVLMMEARRRLAAYEIPVYG